MYAKGKGPAVPSDAQAREKLALYVYEYLLHIGAQKSAQTFLSEIRWEKNITLGEPPGFLHSWWCVFWDLYCASKDIRDSTYGANGMEYNAGPAASPLSQLPPDMPSIPPGFFQNTTMRPNDGPNHPSAHSQPMPHSQMMASQSFMGPRYPGGPRPGVRIPQMPNDFNGPPGQPIMPSMDPSRQGPSSSMNNPRGPSMGPLGPGSYGPGFRGPPPNSALGPGGPMPPMGGRPPWQPNSSTPMNYSSSPLGSYGGPGGSGGPSGPGTPIMHGPQDSNSAGGENMYSVMKPNVGGNLPGDFPMGGPDGPGPIGQMGPVMSGEGMDGIKNFPANDGQGIPREDSSSGMGDYNLGFGSSSENDQNESAAVLKIKESMQEEAKRFEKDPDHLEYFMQ